MRRLRWLVRSVLRQARRAALFVIGMTVLLIGLVMVLAPGPAILVIPAGLGILALEFAWARRCLRASKLRVQLLRRARRLSRAEAR